MHLDRKFLATIVSVSCVLSRLAEVNYKPRLESLQNAQGIFPSSKLLVQLNLFH